MAGILDKKTRIFDYVLTKEGRSQLKDGGDLRVLYATVSDRGVEYLSKQSVDELTYTGAEEVFTTSSLKISDSERHYLGFEATSTFSDSLNPEYNLINNVSFPKINTDVSDQLGLNNFESDVNFSKVVASTTGSFIEKFKSFKILDTFNQINEEEIKINQASKLEDILYNFTDLSVEFYPTVVSTDLSLSKQPSLHEDPRFLHKRNFQNLVPVNVDGSNVIPKRISNINRGHQFIFKKYEQEMIEFTSREASIKETIRLMENDNRLFKSTFEVVNPTEDDTWITQIFEIDEENTKLDKLAVLNVGEFYFENENKMKNILLFGKIFKSQNNQEVKSQFDSLYSVIQEKEVVLSKEYSFINIFTMVIE